MLVRHSPQKHRVFYCLLFLFFVLCYARYAMQISFPRMVLLAMIVMMAFLGNEHEILAVCVCCIPLHSTFHFFYGLLICMAVFVVKYHSLICINLSVLPFFFMIIWELLHCFTLDFSIISFGSDFLPFLLLMLIMCIKMDRIDYAFITRALAICIAFMCILLVGRVLYASGFDLTTAMTGLRRLGMDTEEAQTILTVEGGQQNPNSLGIMCVLGVTGLIQLLITGRGKQQDLFLILLLIFLGALTSSRTYLFCLLIMGVLLYFGQEGSLWRKFKYFLLGCVAVAVVITLLYLILPELLESYIQRFLVADITSSRSLLLRLYHELITSDMRILLWGIGRHNYSYLLMEQYRVAENVPHNAIQEIIIAWGLPGIVLFLLLGIAMIRRSRHFCKNQRLLNYIPIIIIIAKSMVGQLLTSDYTILALSYAYLSMCVDLKLKKSNHSMFILQSPQTSAAYEARDDMLNKE